MIELEEVKKKDVIQIMSANIWSLVTLSTVTLILGTISWKMLRKNYDNSSLLDDSEIKKHLKEIRKICKEDVEPTDEEIEAVIFECTFKKSKKGELSPEDQLLWKRIKDVQK